MRLACLVVPHAGGTFTVFRHLRDGLTAHGHEVRWLATQRDVVAARATWTQTEDFADGILVADAKDGIGQTAAILDALRTHGVEGVFVNQGGDPVQANVVRYLPHEVLRVLLVHSISPGVYAGARSLAPWLHGIAGVSDRIRDDLVARHGFPPQLTLSVPNATELAGRFGPHPGRVPGILRVLSLGRVEDEAKGVLWLPEIMRRVEGATLTVAGGGPDLERLRRRCLGLGERVRFLGPVSPSQARQLYAEHDVLLAPSRFEGFMIVLAEAMAVGCVPIASLIRGVTDMVVEDGRSGLLFPVGDVGAAARALAVLRDDEAAWRAMSCAGQARVARLFTVDRMAAGHAALLRRILRHRPALAKPMSVRDWALPAGLRPGLRTHLPRPLKNLLRTWRERLA